LICRLCKRTVGSDVQKALGYRRADEHLEVQYAQEGLTVSKYRQPVLMATITGWQRWPAAQCFPEVAPWHCSNLSTRIDRERLAVFFEQGKPLVTGQATNEPGLYFCGMVASPTGQLREIGLEARRIGDLAKSYVGLKGHSSV
jgi:hypothetical protein